MAVKGKGLNRKPPAAEGHEDALMRVDRNEITFGTHFKITPTSLLVKNKPTFDQCAEFSDLLRVTDRAIQFAVGDFVNYVEGTFGEEAAQIVDATEWTESTVRVYRWVASKVAPKTRRHELTFAHHRIVADLEPAAQAEWLQRAVVGNDPDIGEPWTVAELNRAMKDGGATDTETHYFVEVKVEDEDGQERLARQVATLGHTGQDVKKITKERRVKAKATTPAAEDQPE